jgi:hypothetical protein
MLARLCAIWLVALIVLPFSAPFATCDANSFFAADDGDGGQGAAKPHSLVGSPGDAPATHALPAARTARVRSSLVGEGTSIAPSPPPALHRIKHGAGTDGSVCAPLALPLRI